jgi:hypothetical protein
MEIAMIKPRAGPTKYGRLKTARSRLVAPLVSFAVMLAIAAMTLLFVSVGSQTAHALPSFARQTGQPCATCHTAFPELTPFGRRFKLNGYTTGGGDSKIPPVAGMVIPTFTNTMRGRDDVNFLQRLVVDANGVPTGINPPPYKSYLGANDNLFLQQASLFYGGQIYGNLGAFIQTTYNGSTNSIFLDNTDIRYADTAKLAGQDFIWGVSLNNVPSVQDVWNTTPAWGFPYLSSSLAPEFGPPPTLVEGGLAGKVVGATAYTFWKDMLYIELTGYKGMPDNLQTALGNGACAPGTAPIGSPFFCTYGNGNGFNDSINGIAPYWRVALEPTWGNNSWEVGTFGLLANLYPSRDTTFGSNRFLDIGFDTQYQYINDEHAITAKATYIIEKQRMNANFVNNVVNGAFPAFPDGTAFLPNRSDTLRSFKASLGYVYDRTYSFTAAFFDVSGTADQLAYGTPYGSPNGRGLIFDVAYMPFSKGGPSAWPWLNMKLGVSYTHYLKVFGSATNFDCIVALGTCTGPLGNHIGHNANYNDTALVYAWIAF